MKKRKAWKFGGKARIVVILRNKLALAGAAQWIECRPVNEPKGHWFDTQAGYVSGLWARSPVGAA